MIHDRYKLVGCLGCLARDSSHINTSLDRLKRREREGISVRVGALGRVQLHDKHTGPGYDCNILIPRTNKRGNIQGLGFIIRYIMLHLVSNTLCLHSKMFCYWL